jgi:Zn-dependent protease
LDPHLILLLPLWYVVFLLSITCHEAAHAWAAYQGGDPTAYLGGQVSLNPLPHMQREPFGTILVPLISFFLFSGQGGRWMIGWASAPYDPYWEDRHPTRAALMAAAGPAANLVLCLVGFLVLKLGLINGWWSLAYEATTYDQIVIASEQAGSRWLGLGRFCSVLFSLNLILCLFNLLPLPPMDGASVLSGFVPAARRLRERIGANPMLGLIGLVLAWNVFPYVLRPVYFTFLTWLYR